MLKKYIANLQAWAVSFANSAWAEYWIIIFSILETSIFFIPADTLVVPLTLKDPKKAWRYAHISTISSLVGAALGWLLGHYAFSLIVKPILIFYGAYDKFVYLETEVSTELIYLFLFTSGLLHFPPMKIMTLLSGAIGLNFIWFIVISAISRGLRSYITAWLLKKYGPTVLDFISQKFTLTIKIVATLLIVGLTIYIILKYSSFI